MRVASEQGSPVLSYTIFYKIDYAAGIVKVYRLLYSKRDWASILK